MLFNLSLAVLFFALSLIAGFIIEKVNNFYAKQFAYIAAGYYYYFIAIYLFGPLTGFLFPATLAIFMIGLYLGHNIKFKKK